MAYLQTLPNFITTIDHGNLIGLDDDDHLQYHTDARALVWLGTRSTSDLPEGSNLYYTEIRVSANSDVSQNTTHRGLTNNPHSTTLAQVLAEEAGTDATVEEIEELTDGSSTTLHIHSSANITYDDSSNNTSLGINVQAALTALESRLYAEETETVDHGDLVGLDDDDHTQYHNDSRGDARYYTQTQLDSGQLDNRYYTQTQLDSGQLDNRYYTESEVDALLAAQDESLEITYDPSSSSLISTTVKDAIDEIAGRLDTNENDIASNSDHGNLSGLGDDDHTQYHTDGRALTWLGTRSTSDLSEGSNLYYTEGRVDANTNVSQNTTHRGLTNNPHSTTLAQVLTADGDTDATSLEIEELTDGSETTLHSHAADGISYDNSGNNTSLGTDLQTALDNLESRLYAEETETVDHGSLDGLDDDDHTQYHNDTRGDARYYTQTQLDAGELDNRYYTESELDSGQLDNRYYTQTQLDAGELDNRYYTETEVDNLLADQNEASEISYDNSTSGLTATDTQAAIDEVEGRLDTAESDISSNETNITDHLDGTASKHDASEIDVENSLDNAASAPSDLETILGELDTTITNNNVVRIVEPSEGGAGIVTAAQDLHAAGGGIVQLKSGTYTFEAEGEIGNLENVIIQGVGDSTVLAHDGVHSAGAMLSVAASRSRSESGISNVTKGDTSVTLSTASHASDYEVGDLVIIQGDDYESEVDYEYNIVKTAGNGTTGVVELEYPILRTMTTCSLAGHRGCKNIMFKNFKIDGTGAGTGTTGLEIGGCLNYIIDNVNIDGNGNLNFGILSQGAPAIEAGCINGIIKECRIENCDGRAIGLRDNINTKVTQCHMINNSTGTQCLLLGRRTRDSFVEHNLLRGDFSHGIGLGSDFCRRCSITNNKIFGATAIGIFAEVGAIVSHNYVESCKDGITTTNQGRDDFVICNNIVKNCETGIIIHAADAFVTCSNNTISTTTDGPGLSIGADDVSACGNVIRGADERGIILAGDRVTLNANVISDSTLDGIIVSGSSNCIISNNTLNNNGGNGINLLNNVTNTTVCFNQTGGDGIDEGTGDGNTYIGNKD